GPQPRGKQVRKPGGIFYTSSTGIWQTAWLEPVPARSIAGLTIVPDAKNGKLRLKVNLRGEGKGLQAAWEAKAGKEGKPITGRGEPGQTHTLDVPDPQLWSPESPFLYDLSVTLLDGEKVVDRVSSYFALRDTTLGKDHNGLTRLFLNGKPYFQVGPLDQGFWPDGLYTAPTDEALRYDIEITKKLGFNMARKHVKVEPARWYYHCDKL